MSAFSSSVINKSSKKIAPKVAVQRRRPGAAPAQSSTRASTDSQRHSETPVVLQTTQQSLSSLVPQPPTTRNSAIDHAAKSHEHAGSTNQTNKPPQHSDLTGDVLLDQRRPKSSSNHRSGGDTRLPSETSPLLTEVGNDPVRSTPFTIEATNVGGSSVEHDDPSASSEHFAKRRKIAPLQTEDSGAIDTLAADISDGVHPTIENDSPNPEPTHIDAAAADKSSVDQNGAEGEAKREKGGRGKAKSSDISVVKQKRKKAVKSSRPQRRRPREPTPENSETIEIAPSIVTMADLCKDSRTGRKSKREQDLQNLDWTSVIRRQQEKQAQRERGEIPARETVDEMLERVHTQQDAEPRGLAAPTLRLVNGKMVLDEQSLQVDRHANTGNNVDTMEEIEENELTRRVTSGSWMKRAKKETWGDDLTDLFYQGLRTFGTDFQIISGMFPGRTRRHIKLKFTREERLNPEKVKDALMGPRERTDLTEYSQHTKIEYDDPAEFAKELEREAEEHAAEQRRREEEAEEMLRHKEDEMVANPALGVEESSAKENEVQDPEVHHAAETNKRTRKSSTKKKRKPLSKHTRGEEVEVLGNIDDIQKG
ncbi:MAG: Transcription factor TFIIIB component B [Sclerophora amabilis]|nr:MAG: Transcription factor TFIIIB component B [Sclerophora amabilis]